MARSAHTLRIVVASIIALILIGGAYALSGPLPFGNIVGAQSAEELLREYAALDSDFDGLPDWQEALYGTDPHNPESFQAGIRDGDAVAQGLIEPRVAVRPEQEPTDINSIPGTTAAPSSLTDRFAQMILTQYLENRGATPPTQAEIVTFISNGVDALVASNVAGDKYTRDQVQLRNEVGAAALVSYAARVEEVFTQHTTPTSKHELAYFGDALKGDTDALETLEDIATAYTNLATALIATPAPSEAAQAHLSLANALAHLGEVTLFMTKLESDPIQALLGISLYETRARELVAAFANLNGVFSARQVSPVNGDAGYYIIKTARDAANSQ